MMVDVDYKKFQSKLNTYCPDNPYSEVEAVEAFHNLVGFISLLLEAEEEVCGRKKIPRQPTDLMN